MRWCVTVKHGEVLRYERMLDAFADYLDCRANDAIGATMWVEL